VKVQAGVVVGFLFWLVDPSEMFLKLKAPSWFKNGNVS